MRQLVLCTLLVASLAAPALAAEEGLGFTAGLTGGIGTHYRRLSDSGWGMGGSASVWSAGPEFAYSLGVQVLRTLSQGPQGRLYAVGGLGVTQAQLQPGMPALLAVGSGLGLQLGRGPGPTLSFEGQMTLVGNGPMGWVFAPMPTVSLIHYY